jgi:hypothetical protein
LALASTMTSRLIPTSFASTRAATSAWSFPI